MTRLKMSFDNVKNEFDILFDDFMQQYIVSSIHHCSEWQCEVINCLLGLNGCLQPGGYFFRVCQHFDVFQL